MEGVNIQEINAKEIRENVTYQRDIRVGRIRRARHWSKLLTLC